MPKIIEQEPQLVKKSNFEYELVDNGDVWVSAKNLDIKIVDTGDGVSVDIYPKGEGDKDEYGSIASAWALFTEGKSDEGQGSD